MLFSETAPYLRYCRRQRVESVGESFVCAYDHRLYYVLSGSGRLALFGREHELSPGTLVYIPSGRRYRFFDTAELTVYCFNFDFTQARAALTEPLFSVTAESFDPTLCPQDVPRDMEIFTECLCIGGAASLEVSVQNVLREIESGKLYCRESAEALFKGLLCELARHSRTSQGTRDAVDILLDYIAEHYAEPLSNAELGALVGYHRNYINTLMLEATGTTLRQYLIEYRLRRACELLLSSELTLDEVARRSGFGNSSYLCRSFQTLMNTTPHKYRESARM